MMSSNWASNLLGAELLLPVTRMNDALSLMSSASRAAETSAPVNADPETMQISGLLPVEGVLAGGILDAA